MWRISFGVWLSFAACGAPAEAAHAAPVERPKEAKPPAPVELTGVTSRVSGSELRDVAGHLRSMIGDALSDADWHGITRDQRLRVSVAVETLSTSKDGEGAHTECVVQMALMDGTGGILGMVRGRGHVDGGGVDAAERDALETAARSAARSLPNAARAALHK